MKKTFLHFLAFVLTISPIFGKMVSKQYYWKGDNGYQVSGVVNYDAEESFALAMGIGSCDGIDYFRFSLTDPDGHLLGDNVLVKNGISIDSQLYVVIDVVAKKFHIPIYFKAGILGSSSYNYSLYTAGTVYAGGLFKLVDDSGSVIDSSFKAPNLFDKSTNNPFVVVSKTPTFAINPGDPIRASIDARYFNENLKLSLSAEAPQGLSIRKDLLEGSINKPGFYSFYVNATDGINVARYLCNIIVINPPSCYCKVYNHELTLETHENQNTSLDPFNFLDDKATYSILGYIPSELVIQDGKLVGVISKQGTYSFTIKATSGIKEVFSNFKMVVLVQ